MTQRIQTAGAAVTIRDHVTIANGRRLSVRTEGPACVIHICGCFAPRPSHQRAQAPVPQADIHGRPLIG